MCRQELIGLVFKLFCKFNFFNEKILKTIEENEKAHAALVFLLGQARLGQSASGHAALQTAAFELPE